VRILSRLSFNRSWTTSMINVISIISLLFSLFPFIESGTGSSTEAVEQVEQQESAQIVFYYPGLEQPDHQLVEEKVNEYVQGKIDAELRLIPIDWGSWDTKVKILFAAGEPMDVLFTAGWSDFHTFANNGMLNDLSSLMNEYTPQLKHHMDPLYLEGTAINGVNYAIPNQTSTHTFSGILFNELLVDKYNFDIKGITKLADLEPMLRTIQEKEKGIAPVFGKITDFEKLAMLERIGFGPGALMPGNGTTIVNEYNTPEMMANLKLFYNWSEKGYVHINKQKDMYSVLGNEKQTFAIVVGGRKADITESLNFNSGLSWVAVPLKEHYISSTDLSSSMLAVPTSSKHPDKAMQFIELLHTDPELLNLLNWGIEGYHWNESEIESNRIELTEFSDGYDPGMSWMIGNPGLASLPTTGYYHTDYNKLQQTFEDAERSALLGFQFDDSTAGATSIAKTYNPFIRQQDQSPEDPVKAVPILVKAMEAGGLKDYITAKQQQIDAFLAEKSE